MKLSLFYILLFCLPIIGYTQDRIADSLILVEIYENLDGPNWDNPENWLTDMPLEEWKGILIQNDRVTKLEIINQGATGPFPEEIIGLDQLHTFEIRQGTISGAIPDGLVNLPLTRFILSSAGMSGTIPNIWTEFDNLQYLSFSQNSFTGNLPDIPDGLILLSFRLNNMTGTIPESWANNTLGNLDISSNNLEGDFDILSTWPNLYKVELNDNNWNESELPEWIDDNINMERFSCNDCNLIGDIPEGVNFNNHKDFQGLFLRNNALSGDITQLFPSDEASEDLYMNVANNDFSGEFPAHLVKNFSRLIISGNDFDSITEFGDITLNTCDIKGNRFTYEALMPIMDYIEENEMIPVDYRQQKNTLTADTFEVSEPMTITLDAGDNHPSTTYQWFKNNQLIEEEETSSLTIYILSNEQSGSYYCKMANLDFPELQLNRNNVIIQADISTSTENVASLGLTLFPNPTTEYINISGDNIQKGDSFLIINQSGKTVAKGALKNKESMINIQSLYAGQYSIIITSVDGREGVRFIKK